MAALETPRGARAMALGGAYSALAADGSAVEFNPACLALVRQGTLSFSHQSLVLGAAAEQASFAANAEGLGELGGEITYLGFGNFEKRGQNGELLEGNISPNAVCGRFGWGGAFLSRRMALGAAMGVLQQTVVSRTQVAFDFNVGGLWVLDSNTRLCAGAASLGGGLGENVLPTKIYLGAASRREITANDGLLLAIQAQAANSTPGSAGAGLEYQWNKLACVRAGWQVGFEEQTLDGPQGLGLGAGLSLDWGRLDYGINFAGVLGLVHCVSLTFLFGN
jgi:hypothetical protein